MMRVLGMLLCFGLLGLNIWCIAELHGGVLNYVSAVVCLGAGLYAMSSLIKYP